MSDQSAKGRITRRDVLKTGVGIAGAAAMGPLVLSACGGSSGDASSSNTTAAANGGRGALGQAVGGPDLLSSAKKNGALRTVAVGEKGSFYTPVIEGFTEYAGFAPDTDKALYPPKSAVLDIEKSQDNPPFDVLETSVDWAAKAVEENLVTGFRTSLWDDIPAEFKDPAATWSAAYFGTVSFTTTLDADKAPKSWEELVSKGAKESLGMLGNPAVIDGETLSGGLALLTVLSASLANGGSLDDVGPGIDLFKELREKGIYVPFKADGTATAANLAIPAWVGNGSVPVGCLFSFDVASTNWYAEKEKLTARSFTPTDGPVSGFYCQSLVSNAKNIDAARLWVEYLQSDFGAERFLQGGAIPTRHGALRSDPKVADKVKALLPDEKLLERAKVPSGAQLAKAQDLVNQRWNKEILGN